MYRVLIGSAFHETNSFWPHKTGIAEFSKRDLLFGEDIGKKFRNTRTPLGAFIEVLENAGIEVIFTVAANAEPSGTVTKEAFDLIKNTILDGCRNAGKLDGILLSLHGAMETEIDEDGEGNLLEALREAVGNDIPIVTTLDLHTNLTGRMVSLADAFFPYREYPHSDMYLRGLEAAKTLISILNGTSAPVMRWCHVPLLTSLVATSLPSYQPIADVLAECNEMPGVLGATLLHGFFMADTQDTMLSVLVVTENDPELAQLLTDRIAHTAWKNRDALTALDACSPEEAILEAKNTTGTAVFADICDNPGAGSSSDGTHLLRALLLHSEAKTAFAAICDPETVKQCQQAGVGASIEVSLGGKVNPGLLGQPITGKAYVKSLHDGIYYNRGPMHGGMQVNLKGSAVLQIGKVSVIVTSIPTQAYDIEIFQAHGLMLHDFDVLVVKSSVHYRAAFGPHADRLIPVKCPGAVELDPRKLHYRRKKAKLYPLDTVTGRIFDCG